MAENKARCIADRIPQIAVVDDDLFVLKMWSLSNANIKLHTFRSPRAFWQAMAEDPELLTKLDCVITDHYFEADDDMIDGAQFARDLKKVFRRPVILNSNLLFGAGELHDAFDFQVDSKTSSWCDIAPLLH